MSIIPLVVPRRPAQRGDRGAVVDPLGDSLAVQVLCLPGLLEIPIARLLEQMSDPVHRPVEVFLDPLGRVRGPVLDLRQPVGIDRELERGRALGAERAPIDRAVRVPLDVDDLLVLDADDLGAPDRAVGADAGDLAGALDLQLGDGGLGGFEVQSQAGEGAGAGSPAEELAAARLPWIHGLELSRYLSIWRGSSSRCRRYSRAENEFGISHRWTQ